MDQIGKRHQRTRGCGVTADLEREQGLGLRSGSGRQFKADGHVFPFVWQVKEIDGHALRREL